jgi:hypothetical protein
MADLILTIPSTDRGGIAIRHLLEAGREELGCSYEHSLSDQLRGLESSRVLQELPHSFHRVWVRDGDEAGAINRILRFHDGEGAGRGKVEAAERNETMMLSAPYLGLPFKLGGKHTDYLRQMNVGDAHHHGVKGNGVHIAIVDSGLQSSAGINAVDFYDVQTASPVHAGLSAMVDNDGHGTAMASLTAEVAPEASIYVVRVMDQGSLTLWNVLAGVGVGAFDCRAAVISLSFGFSGFMRCRVCGATGAVRSIAFEKLLDGITQSPYLSAGRKPVYVASTGNDGSSTCIDYPAAYETAVPVGAVNSKGDRASFSNYDQGTTHKRHLMGPGGEKTTANVVTEDVGTGGRAQCCGTSVAAAYAAGMLAVLWSDSRYDKLDSDRFLDMVLNDHCVRATSQPQNEYGAGVIQYKPPLVSDGDTKNGTKDVPANRISISNDRVVIESGSGRVWLPRKSLKRP